jgi:hypothetical protein
MRHDTIEISRARTATSRPRAARTSDGDRTATVTMPDAAPIAVIDEAFADFDRFGSQPAPQGGIAPGRQMLNQLLVSRLSAQLEALDCQREQLAQLLRSVDSC